MDPVLEGVAERLGNKVTVIKIDSRSAHDLNREYKVKGTPSMLLFKDGQEVVEAREDIQVGPCTWKCAPDCFTGRSHGAAVVNGT